jgi:hypothetical protein
MSEDRLTSAARKAGQAVRAKRRASRWYNRSIEIAAGLFTGGAFIVWAWNGDLAGFADTPRELWTYLPLLFLLFPVVVLLVGESGLRVAMIVAAPGILIAAAVALVRGQPEYAAPLALYAVLGAAICVFLIPLIEDTLLVVGQVIRWGVPALLSGLGKVGARAGMADCPKCGVERPAIRRSYVAYHVLATILTVGWWLPVWYVLAKRQRFRCVECLTAVEVPPGKSVALRAFQRPPEVSADAVASR